MSQLSFEKNMLLFQTVFIHQSQHLHRQSKPEPHIPMISPKQVSFIPSIYPKSKKIVIFDLDETLVHSSFKQSKHQDYELNIILQEVPLKIYVSLRPGALEIIDILSEYYDIILWTASLKEYANVVMDILDPNKKCVMRLFRNSCTIHQGYLIKDLTRITKNLKDILIVDVITIRIYIRQNSSNSFQFQPQNGFQIKNYFFDKKDRELYKLIDFLKWLSSEEDFRPIKNKYQQYQQLDQQQIKTNITGRTSGRSTCTRLFRSLTDRDQEVNQLKRQYSNKSEINIAINQKNSSAKQFSTIDSADIQEISNEGLSNINFEIQRCIKN